MRLKAIWKGVIKAKILALLSLRLLKGYPDESKLSFWPPHPRPADTDEQDYIHADYRDYFKSRGSAVFLRKEAMDCILFQFIGTDVQKELNEAAHTAGINPCNLAETRSLLELGAIILDNTSAVKSKLPTYQSLLDIVTHDRNDEGCPLNKAMVVNAVWNPDKATQR